MQFRPYPKIHTATSTDNDKSKRWVVLEKVHGANFSVYCDLNGQVRFAKRTGFLAENEWFYGYQTLSDDLTAKVTHVFEEIKKHHKPAAAAPTSIVLYGELCGGFYPAKVDSWTGPVVGRRVDEDGVCLVPQRQRAVQEGVYYSPYIEFIAFDLIIVKEGVPYFMDYGELSLVCSATGIKLLKPRFIGLYCECLNQPCKFDSNVASELCGQQRLPVGTNYAEGIVIKPLKENVAATRSMIKIKQAGFLEIASTFVQENMEGAAILLTMINIHRLNALSSKVGKVLQENADKFVEELIDDTLVDYYESFPNTPICCYDETMTHLRAKARRLLQQSWILQQV